MLIVRNRITLINMQSMYEITVVILPQRTHLIGNKESVCLLVLFWCARFVFFHTRRAYWEIFLLYLSLYLCFMSVTKYITPRCIVTWERPIQLFLPSTKDKFSEQFLLKNNLGIHRNLYLFVLLPFKNVNLYGFCFTRYK